MDTGRRLSDQRRLYRRTLSLRRRLAVSRHPGSDVRIRRGQEHHLARSELQWTRALPALARHRGARHQRQRRRRSRWLRLLRSQEQGRETACGGAEGRCAEHGWRRLAHPAPHRQLHQRGAHGGKAVGAHRRRRKDRDALPPRHHRAASRAEARHRSEERTHPARRCRGQALVARVRSAVEAGGVSLFHEDRYFDPDPTIRRHARALYEETRALPIVSPHGHVDPAILARNEPFADPTSLFITPDHYVLRMLFSRGVPLESLGVAPIDGAPPTAERDPRKIWQTFADHWQLFRATPTRAWLEYEIRDVFGIKQELDAESAATIYDTIAERLKSVEFRPRALLKRFNIEVLATTDGAGDNLEHHRTLRQLDSGTRVIPTFRPDALFRIGSPGWTESVAQLERIVGTKIESCAELVSSIERRRREFKALGATATDHAVLVPRTHRLDDADAESLFAKARRQQATPEDEASFEAHLLMEMARLSIEDGLVMQLHPGALRNHNHWLFHRFGPDVGGDIPVATEFTRNLRPL